MNLSQHIAHASWHEVERVGDFVKMRRGPESGWWHDHNDGKDLGGNPCNWEGVKVRCTTCGKQRPTLGERADV